MKKSLATKPRHNFMSFDHRYQYYIYDAKQVVKLKEFDLNEKDDNMVLVNAP